MSEFNFYINIESTAGAVVGSGPITSASGWTYTARMDRAGSFSFSMPATDPKAPLVQKKRIARAFALVGGAWLEVGAGIIDNIQMQPGDDGITILQVAGDDLLRELTYRSVLDLKIYDNNAPISHAAALAAVGAYAPAGWTFTPDAAPPGDLLYGRFNGHNVLAGIAKIAEKSQNHFYRSTGRAVVFASSFTASGVRAIRADGADLASGTCAIRSLTQQIDTYDLITRIYPRGSGNGDVQLTLRATTRAAPAGYTLDTTNNYIEATAATASYGRIEQQVDFKDIGPIENTSADLQAAADMLFDAALEELKRRSTELEQATYTLELEQCGALLRPLQSIVVDYSDPDAGLTVRATLNILEATWSVDAAGVQTTGLIVSTVDRWPDDDVSTIADSVQQASLYQALPQLNANSYVTGYTKNVDRDEVATFRFRFGGEVVQLQQVLFEFQLLQFESTVKSVGGETSGAAAIPTSGPNMDTTNSAGVTTTGSGGATATDTGGPTTTGSTAGDTGSAGSADTGSTTPTIGSITPTIGGATPTIGSGGSGDTGSATPTIGSVTPSIGSAGSADTGSGGSGDSGSGGSGGTGSGGSGDSGGTSLTTGSPQGGDVVSAGRHLHGLPVVPRAGETSLVYFHANGSNSFFVADGSSGNVPTGTAGDHTHSISSHTHSVGSHTHSGPSHTHTVAAHTHTAGSHTHTIAAHTHTISAHTHTAGSHDHTIAAHTHTIAAHTHTISAHTHTTTAHTHTVGGHTHTVTAHTHTITQHTHSLSQHTHSLSNHTHDLSEAITAIYGIFRESAANTYATEDLEYRVNAGAWGDLNVAEDIGNSWLRLDVSGDVMDAITFRPVQESNSVEIRARTVTISSIQKIADPGTTRVVTTAVHRLIIGDVIIIAGTSAYNGEWTVTAIQDSTTFDFVSTGAGLEATGTVKQVKTVTVDALLSVRNIIQAVRYT